MRKGVAEISPAGLEPQGASSAGVNFDISDLRNHGNRVISRI